MSPHPRPHTVALTRPSLARLVLNVVKEGVMSIAVEQGRSSAAATATYTREYADHGNDLSRHAALEDRFAASSVYGFQLPGVRRHA